MYTQIAAMAGKAIVKNWKPILIVVCLAASLYAIKGIVQTIAKNKELKDYQEKRIPIENPATGVKTEISPKLIAYDIYDAFYHRGWGLFEDEKQAIKTLKSVPPSIVPTIAEYYSKIDGKNRNLYEDFRRFLKDKKYSEVVAWLN